MNFATIKRQIVESDNQGIRKKLENFADVNGHEEFIEMGEAYEKMTQSKGWMFAEAYIIQKANPVNHILSDTSETEKGVARGLIEFLQHINETIRMKNDLLEKINAERESKKETKDNS